MWKIIWCFSDSQVFLLVSVCLAEDLRQKEKNTKISNAITQDNLIEETEPPEGYYAFVESPNADPPKVRPPPYAESDKECYGKHLKIT